MEGRVDNVLEAWDKEHQRHRPLAVLCAMPRRGVKCRCMPRAQRSVPRDVRIAFATAAFDATDFVYTSVRITKTSALARAGGMARPSARPHT